MTIPWGTSRHRDFFFLIWELSTLSCSVPSALLSSEPGPGTSGHVARGAISSCPRAGAVLRGNTQLRSSSSPATARRDK